MRIRGGGQPQRYGGSPIRLTHNGQGSAGLRCEALDHAEAQSRPLSDGLRQLTASKNPRKAIILATAADTRSIPGGIQVIQADPKKLLDAVIEVRCQYLLRFQPSEPAARIEVIVNPPRGLPILKPVWKALF